MDAPRVRAPCVRVWRVGVLTLTTLLYEADVDNGRQRRNRDTDSCPVLFDTFVDYRSKASYVGSKN